MSEVFEDVACTRCGCVCDDLRIAVNEGRIHKAEGACGLAEDWFAQINAETKSVPTAEVRGQATSLDSALNAAIELLQCCRAPLIYGLSRSSTDGQRAAVALADALGAAIDTTASTCHAPSIMALQDVGESTASLGEVRQRSDLVVYWGSNPLISHPRHLERVVEAPGTFAPRGRADRHLVVVDVEETETAREADTFIKIAPGSDFDVLWALRGLARDRFFGADVVGGVPIAELQTLADRLTSCRYGAVFFGLGLTNGPLPHRNVTALLQLVTDLHRHTRFIARRMRVPGDVAGADSVLCWQTGFPFSVQLGRGYPRFNPGEFTANGLLERNEVDGVVLVGTEGVPKLSQAAQQTLRGLPTIVLDPPHVQFPFVPTVAIRTAIYGIDRAGTAYRMDETPIPLRPIRSSEQPSDDEVLAGILHGVKRTSSAENS